MDDCLVQPDGVGRNLSFQGLKLGGQRIELLLQAWQRASPGQAHKASCGLSKYLEMPVTSQPAGFGRLGQRRQRLTVRLTQVM
jgi:hypothetical protein